MGSIFPGTPVRSGLDSARPAASGGLVGSYYYATDTLAVYLCVSTTTWVVASAGMESDKASWGVFAANNIFQCTAEIPKLPAVKPLANWRGKEVTAEIAQGIMIGHLAGVRGYLEVRMCIQS
mgnify:CR=1 FL=1